MIQRNMDNCRLFVCLHVFSHIVRAVSYTNCVELLYRMDGGYSFAICTHRDTDKTNTKPLSIWRWSFNF